MNKISPPSSRSPLLFLSLMVLIIAIIAKQSFKAWSNILVWRVPDNDDAMRVLEVRAWLNGQNFYDIVNHRLNPPNGGDIHWSRIGDLPLAFVELVLRPFYGTEFGEKIAVFLTPLFLEAIFAILAGLCIARFAKGYVAIFIGAIMALLTAAVTTYFQPGRVDHHGLQMIFALLALWGLFAQNKTGSIIAGIAIALSITIGFETVVIVGVMIIWVAIIWGIRGNKEVAIPFTISLALSTIVGFLINVPPSEFLIVQNDALSIAQLFPILAGCFGLLIAAIFLSYSNIYARFIGLGVVGIIVIAVALQFPILLEKPYFKVSPLMHRLWLNSVSETRSLFKSRVPVQIMLGMFEVIASIAILVKIFFIARDKKHKPQEFDNWILLASILVSLTLLAFFWQLRIAGMSQSFAIVAAGALFVDALNKSSLKNALFIILIVNPMVPSIFSDAYEKIKPDKTNFRVGGGVSCTGINSFKHLATLPEGLIAANIDFGAPALLATHHKVLAAPYHRNQGNLTAYNIFLAKPDKALELIKAANVDYVGFCQKSGEIKIISTESPTGLMKQLVDKKYPDYLELVPAAKDSGIMIWKVRK